MHCKKSLNKGFPYILETKRDVAQIFADLKSLRSNRYFRGWIVAKIRDSCFCIVKKGGLTSAQCTMFKGWHGSYEVIASVSVWKKFPAEGWGIGGKTKNLPNKWRNMDAKIPLVFHKKNVRVVCSVEAKQHKAINWLK